MTPAPNDAPQNPSKTWILFFGAYLIALNLVMLYLLFRLWPSQFPLKSEAIAVRLLPGAPELYLGIETRYLLLVVVVWALGSYIHLATSFADYLGNRQFVSSWSWWYILRPFIGMALAIMVYFAARGGLIAGASGAENLSPYGVAALAGLAGMFSKQATDKLRETFEELFRTKSSPRADSLQYAGGAQRPTQD